MAARGKYNVGIIGYGLSAKIFHIPFVNAVPDFNLYAIVQRRPKPDDDASKDWPNIKAYRSTEEMVNDDQVHVIVVTTAPESHLELAKAALLANKHGIHPFRHFYLNRSLFTNRLFKVVVEKPFTPTSAEAQELVDLAKAQNKILTVYQNRRWDSDFLTLKKYIEDGTLGRIVEFETHFDRHRPEPPTDNWKAYHAPGTGAIYDLGTHLMDQVVCLFGMPKRVTGFVGSQREVNTTGLEDSCTVLLHYDSPKMLVTVKAGVVSPEVNQLRYWVRGDKGSFKKFHLDPQEDQLRKEGLRPGDKGYGIESEDNYGTLNVCKDGKVISQVAPTVEPATYTEYYRRLAAALSGDVSQVPVAPEQAVGVIRLVELARESSQLGRTLSV
ncbi:oxidoreductase [Cladophialophora psammophila CBS 110553]|uniref:Oxidoreductase n=1 Tax=Cladophialophora psammophila CBS 110553 TaxID=1182543 RepID=W9WDV5_9EURO|nr:oxidoreductase [Cladophialophora psammophila CBS 110553]EXJ66123.1 oxidoreductase [Cladophialophora psammophila CBS 110553]